ncbi:MAG: bifunctional riboflavin kinase/FAD synthetase [Flavobacteriaceae bacterium]|nr:bifunctional riboflavin kinase/FAD synthetase [Flavobacteriaceae bacterium]
MKIYSSIEEFKPQKPSVVTIGTFDGVHSGHRKIIDRLVAQAKISGYESVLLSFFPHPRMVVQHQADIKLLHTLEERAQILESTGLDHLIVHPFSKDFARQTAESYIENILVKALQTKHIIIGYDHRFGKNRTADISDLRSFGEHFHFDVTEISAQEIDEVAVSSTKIRAALETGEMHLANDYLGYEYILTGIIVHGKGIGKDLGFPTANLRIAENYKLIPKSGVYVVKSRLLDRDVFGMMNIGSNPTVGGEGQHIEINFFDIDEDLYGQKVQVRLLEYLRAEQKFESLQALKAQLSKDRENALKFLK